MKNEQQAGLFDDELPQGGKRPRVRNLVLAAQPDRPLTKAQSAFNRLVTKIEKLRASLERETLRLDAALVEFTREIPPRRQRQTALLKELVRALAPFLSDRRLKKKDMAVLREIIANQLDNIAAADAAGLEEEDLRKLFKTVNGISVEDSQAEAMAGVKDMMSEMFGDLGVDLDFEGLRPDMSEAEVAAYAARMAERLQQPDAATSAARPARAKSKRQLAKEESARQAEELRNRSIGSVYKQLAKLLHPDLELDPARKQQKVALMQELTTAYQQQDLHTLLRLEIEWIRGEQGDVAHLTDEKLALYNQVLREQAAELEDAVFMLPQQPRYQAMAQTRYSLLRARPMDVAAESKRLEATIASIEGSLVRLRAGEGLEEVRESIAAYREAGPIGPGPDIF